MVFLKPAITLQLNQEYWRPRLSNTSRHSPGTCLVGQARSLRWPRRPPAPKLFLRPAMVPGAREVPEGTAAAQANGDSALSSVDRPGFAVSQRLDIAHRRLAEETAVLPAELAYALVAHFVSRARGIHPVHEHALPGRLQP